MDDSAGTVTVADAVGAAALLAACRFSDGATLWAVAPGRDDHARHIAVEFVHPVIVGTASLPALAITASDAVGEARACVRNGDVLVLVGEAGCSVLAELAARAVAWGVATIWLVLGDAPVAGAADVIVGCGAETDFVRSYHLLWELCHVCLQHPNLLASNQGAGVECAVCADEALTAEVVSIGDDRRVNLRAPCGSINAVDLVGGLKTGDLVLAHAGVVIGRRT